ncbi:MAG TPA: hypothetical protein VFR18_00165 [Terriglobia bacterium]|nr:hypothetical protein [Terriglobia bacterium]
MSAIHKLLDRLDRAKQAKAGSWVAGCPCCRSRQGRPIRVTEASDGRVLLHAFCGCETKAVLDAIGLKFADLFDAPLTLRASSRCVRFSARDLLEVVSKEMSVAAVIASDFLERRSISNEDWARLALAAQRIGATRDYVR